MKNTSNVFYVCFLWQIAEMSENLDITLLRHSMWDFNPPMPTVQKHQLWKTTLKLDEDSEPLGALSDYNRVLRWLAIF